MIIFNGISSQDVGVQIEHLPNYEIPEKEYDMVHVPGRNGDVAIYKDSYKNVPRKYDIAVASMNIPFHKLANTLTEWLHSASGYARLEDSYEPEYYRLAIYKETGEIDNILGQAGRMTITFDCKPQRYLKTGDEKIIFEEAGIITNPTSFESTPIITVNGSGSGTINIGHSTINIRQINNSVTINSEIQDIYSGTVNRNGDIVLPSTGFPKLYPGENNITFYGGITSVEVIAKWWTI